MTPGGNADGCENEGVEGKAIRKNMKTKGEESGEKERRQTPTPRCDCVNAVDKGVSGRFGVNATGKGLTARVGVPLGLARGKKAVDTPRLRSGQEGLAALNEGGNDGWADARVAGGVRRGLERAIGANVGVNDSRRGTRGQLVGGTVEVQLARSETYRTKQPEKSRYAVTLLTPPRRF